VFGVSHIVEMSNRCERGRLHLTEEQTAALLDWIETREAVSDCRERFIGSGHAQDRRNLWEAEKSEAISYREFVALFEE
jgi:hypothetical protein